MIGAKIGKSTWQNRNSIRFSILSCLLFAVWGNLMRPVDLLIPKSYKVWILRQSVDRKISVQLRIVEPVIWEPLFVLLSATLIFVALICHPCCHWARDIHECKLDECDLSPAKRTCSLKNVLFDVEFHHDLCSRWRGWYMLKTTCDQWTLDIPGSCHLMFP